MTELLLCPFCGSRAVIEPLSGMNWVRCTGTDCALVDEPGNSVLLNPEAWNTRSIDAMREALEHIRDYDDGAWAAGKHGAEARRQGMATIRAIARTALRGMNDG